MATAAERLARELQELRRRLEGLERSAAADLRSIDDGTLTAHDEDGNEVLRVGRQEDGSYKVEGRNGGRVVADEHRPGSVTAEAILDGSIGKDKVDFYDELADGDTIQTFFGPDEPSDVDEGDLWLDEDAGLLKRWNGSSWDVIQDPAIQSAIEDAADAKAAADGKITTFVSETEPTAEGEGDFWVDPSQGNLLHRWQDGSWLPIRLGADALQDGAITETKIEDDAVSTPKLQANSVTAPKVLASSITADRLTVGVSGVSILVNGTMEDPAVGVTDYDLSGFGGWKDRDETALSIDENTTDPISGSRSMRIGVGTAGDVRIIQTQRKPITSGQRWLVKAKVRATRDLDNLDAASGNAVELVFQSSNGQEEPEADESENVVWTVADSRTDVVAGEVYDLEGIVVVPSGSGLNRVQVAVNFPAPVDGSSIEWDLDEVYCYPATTGIRIVDPEGEIVASIDDQGSGEFHDLGYTGTLTAFGDTFTVDGSTFDEVMRTMPRGVVARGRRDPNVSGIETEYGTMEFAIPAIPDAASRQYVFFVRFFGAPSMSGSDLTGVIRSRLRYESAPVGDTPASPSISSTLFHNLGLPAVRQTGVLFSYQEAMDLADDTEYRVLHTLQPAFGMDSFETRGDTEVLVVDVGPRMGNSGVKNSGGGSLGSGGSDTGGDSTPDPVTRTKTWTATWSSGYNGSGSRISNGSNHKVGYYSATNGNTKAAIGFNDSNIRSTLSGASVDKVELYLYFNHWYYNGGGTAVIGRHAKSGNTSSWSTIGSAGPWSTDVVRSKNWPKPGGRWVNISSMASSWWKNGDTKGILMGPGPTNAKEFYGTFNGVDQNNPPKLRITYTK